MNVKVNGEEGFGIGDCGLAAEPPPLAHSHFASGFAINSLTRKELGILGKRNAESGKKLQWTASFLEKRSLILYGNVDR